LREKSVITRTITVAGGVFSPGHLGELTRYVPFELVDAVLEETGTTQRRLLLLPARVGVYFLLALGLFPQSGYLGVWDRLVAGLRGLAVVTPSEKALRDLRRRLGAAPMKALFEAVAVPLAQPRTPGVRYRSWRTVAFDGCTSIKAPDVERVRAWLGKNTYRQGQAGYPALELMTLVETGTRGLLGAVFGPTATGETDYATRLLPLLDPSMLVLADAGFDGGTFLAALAATGTKFLVRGRSSRRPPALLALADGSYLSRINGVTVRIIEADLTTTLADGTAFTSHYRLITTLLNPRRHPATTLIRLYHERWEIESAYYALRHTLLHGGVLRSGDRVGIEQEMWAHLTLYQALRTAMATAAESLPGTDPDRAAFTVALEAAREYLTSASGVIADPTDSVGDLGRRILARLLPPRRPRTSSRKVKSPTSRYHTHTAPGRPTTSTDITAIDTTVRPRPADPPPTGPKAFLIDRTLAFLHQHPDQHWHSDDIAQALEITNRHSFRTLINKWTREGHITRVAKGRYSHLPKPTNT
jgi:hypothetical protein